MICRWCGAPLEELGAEHQVYCSVKCRQTAWRSRRAVQALERASSPLRMAYADPPYPGMASIYKGEASYAGEVDHATLIASLRSSCDGWALSTSPKTLQHVLALCPEGVRVASWVKPIGVPSTTHGAHTAWEPIVYVPGRRLRPGFRDWVRAMPARGGGELLGRKPLAVVAFVFRLLGLRPGDHFEDLFPGSGVVGRAWAELNRASLLEPGDASPLEDCDASHVDGVDASPGCRNDAS